MGLQMQNGLTKNEVLFKIESIFIAYVLRSKYISNFKLRYIHSIFRSERLLLNIKWAIIQPYYGENKLHFDELMMSTVY